MKVTEDQFVEEVARRMAEEHGVPTSRIREEYETMIRSAYPTEQHITPDELDTMIHGDGETGIIPPEYEEHYPMLSKVALAPYGDGMADEQDEPDEDDDDDDDDSDDEESESEEDED